MILAVSIMFGIFIGVLVAMYLMLDNRLTEVRDALYGLHARPDPQQQDWESVKVISKQVKRLAGLFDWYLVKTFDPHERGNRMNRRHFFGALLAAPAVATVAKAPQPPPLPPGGKPGDILVLGSDGVARFTPSEVGAFRVKVGIKPDGQATFKVVR